MKKEMNERDKKWVIGAIEKDMTRLQVKRKLQEHEYPEKKVDIFLDFYDECQDEIKRMKQEENKEKESSESEFKDSVRKYADKETRKELSRKERRDVRIFLRNVNRYLQTVKIAIEGFKKEIDHINSQDWSKGKIEKELGYTKEEMIARIVESKQILEIEHPHTGEDVTEKNLKSLEMDELIELMEENVNTLDLVVNGKITDET